MQNRVVVTVDGLAGSGKTTLSNMLADKLGFCHLNSGILYRAVGYLALSNQVSPKDAGALEGLLDAHQILLDLNEQGESVLSIDGTPYTSELQVPAVSESTSRCASMPVVRKFLEAAQRDAFPGRALVAEGRDMGTVIFPDAPAKFFIEADVSERVKRRIKQLSESNPKMSLKERNDLEKQMEIEIVERDARDTSRAIAPTVPAADAIIVNNSAQTLTRVIQYMYDSVASKGLV
jgi:cytidylate kinase